MFLFTVSVPPVWLRDLTTTAAPPVLKDTRESTVRGQTQKIFLKGFTTQLEAQNIFRQIEKKTPYCFALLNFFSLFCPGVPPVTMATPACQAAAVRSVSVLPGGRCPDRATLSRASAVAGWGRREGCVTSAWKGMCVERPESSVRLTNASHRTRFFIQWLIHFMIILRSRI